MGCSHARHCPLFPYLNASLGSWREAYCDSAAGWSDCARYRLSSNGEPVPLALLPNGRLPVSMIPNLARAEAAQLTSPPAPGGSAEARSELPPLYLDYPVPPPRPAPQPFRPLTDLWRRAVGSERWTRVVSWLRAPA